MKYAYAYKLKRIFAYVLVVAEQFTKSFWRIFFWTIFFSGLWMLQLPGLFERAGLYITSITFFSGILYFLWRDTRSFHWPGQRQISRRLESESALKHRPLSETDDTPITSHTPQSYELWLIEKQRREDDFQKIKFITWRENLSEYDPYGLRLIAILVLSAGIFVAGTDWQNRIMQGILPLDWYGTGSNIPPIVVTITPPDYTGAKQIVIQAGKEQTGPYVIPVNSQIQVLMSEAILHPDVVNLGSKTPMDNIEDGGYELEWTAKLPENYSGNEQYKIDVKQFLFTNFSLDYTILPDKSPEIRLQELSEEEVAALKKQNLEKAEWQVLREKMQSVIEEQEQKDESGQDLESEENTDSDQNRITDAEDELKLEDIKKEAQLLQKNASQTYERQPKILPDGQIQIPLTVTDDYSVSSMTMKMTLAPEISNPPIGHSVTQERSIMSPPGKDLNIAPVYDFTNNPWAGLPVHIDLSVTDQVGQITHLKTIDMTLPEREFVHPIARQLISMRKQLAWSPLHSIPQIRYDLGRLLQFPEDFQDDITVYLALSMASQRLAHSALKQNQISYPDTRSVMALLWDTALRIEGGDLAIAARNLRYAQMALETALRETDLSQERISQLMAELRQAMGAYLLEFKKELQKQFAAGEDLLLTPEALDELMNPDALAQFLGKMELEMRDGNTQRAQGMLSQLQNMLDMLNPNMALPMPEDMRFMADSVSEMQQLIDNQTSLKNQTQTQAEAFENFNTSQDFGKLLPENMDLFMQWGLDNLPPPPTITAIPNVPFRLDTTLNKNEQEALRFVLGQLMIDSNQYLGNIPEKMGLAEREMLFSGDQLSQNSPTESIPHQELAIKYLTEAQQEMQDELAKRLQEMSGGSDGDQQMPGGSTMDKFGERFSQNQGQRFDPLGRPLPQGEGNEGDGEGSPYPDSNVKVPDEAERKRVEEILRILRDRSGELYRPREELDYFRRLLRQF